jgi:hypothetical protein
VEGVVEKLRVDDFYAVLAKEAVDLLYLVGREVDFLQQVEDFPGLQRGDFLLTGFQQEGTLAGLKEFLNFLYISNIAPRL